MVLADRDKVEMDDLIREKVHPKRTRVVTRSGSPIDLGHLGLVRPEKARSIVVLSPEGDEEPDAQVIKTILALTKGRGHRDRFYHVVAEIQEPRNLQAAHLVGGDEVVLIDKRETIAKLVVHSARQSGASVAFIELLDFKGDEIYFREEPSLVGRPFSEALLAYEDCSPIGVIDAAGTVSLNPSPERPVAAGEQARSRSPPTTPIWRRRRRRRGRWTPRRSSPLPRPPASRRASSCSAGTRGRRL